MWFIRLFTQENDVVLDPFLGSGTTAVATSLNGRKYLGIELKKEYFDEASKNVNEIKKVVSRKLKKKI